MKLLLKLGAYSLAVLFGALTFVYLTINDYQSDGEISLNTLSAAVTIYRDENSIPYIAAQNMPDALQAQGFLTAQLRTYQLQLYRLLALGRLSEVFGERAFNNDLLIRMIDINGLAKIQTSALDANATVYYQNYVHGINAYLQNHQDEHPFELGLLGFKPELWTLQDIVAIQLFQSWANGSAWKTDLINLQLIDEVGADRAQQIAQISINPEDGSRTEANLLSPRENVLPLMGDSLALNTLRFLDQIPNALTAGSNAWASGSRLSKNGKPILANNPHLPVGNLPGFWLPMSLFTPELKTAGVHAPASPGIGAGRNNHIAWGATVGGSDGADIYIEQLDPNLADHYLEAGQSLPLRIHKVSIKVKDKDAEGGLREERVRFRFTPRGPLISDHAIGYTGNRALSLRWAAAQTLTNPSLGSDRLLFAKSISQAEEAMRLFPGALSHITIDQQGGIARVSSGRVPIRSIGDGAKPMSVTNLAEDNWLGLIPASEMPKQVSPNRDWVGTANHRIIKSDYPYQYSKNFASSWRYRRIQEFFESKNSVSADDHWQLINDIKNPLAEHLTPLYIEALEPNHPKLAKILGDWGFRDRAEQAAPAIFQVITKHLANLTFSDELSAELWKTIFDTPYFWQERLVDMLNSAKHPWFDIQNSQRLETRDDIVELAITAAVQELETAMGDDPEKWQWGDIHTITFNSPIIPGKAVARFLGGGTHPMSGSGETLNRAAYRPSQSYDTTVNDSVRLVVDLSNDDQLLAITPGGISARYFDPTLSQQSQDWLEGVAQPIYFNLDKVVNKQTGALLLKPN